MTKSSKLITTPYSRSPLKWAGGKYYLLPQICKHLPKDSEARLVEPFLGSAVILLNTDYKSYLLNDLNPDLIAFYQTVQTQGSEFIAYAKKLFHARYNTPEQYYKLRIKFNNSLASTEKSALFLYLNRHSYNGLCRYNQKLEFNTPFGRYTKPYFPEKELHDFYVKSQKAVFTCKPFEKTLQQVQPGDVVYCDPPYVPLSQTAYFTQYFGCFFEEPEQNQLAKIAEKLARKDIKVLVSNHNTQFTRKIYKSAKLIKYNAPRFISCNKGERNTASELLAIF